MSMQYILAQDCGLLVNLWDFTAIFRYVIGQKFDDLCQFHSIVVTKHMYQWIQLLGHVHLGCSLIVNQAELRQEVWIASLVSHDWSMTASLNCYGLLDQ